MSSEEALATQPSWIRYWVFGKFLAVLALPFFILNDPAATENCEREYIVKEGDTLRKVAQSMYDDPSKWPRLFIANKNKLRADLQLGQILRVPCLNSAKREPPATIEAQQKAEAEAQQKAEAEARQKADAEARQKAKAQRKAEAEIGRLAEALIKAKAEIVSLAEAVIKAEAEIHRLGNALRRIEAEVRRKVGIEALQTGETESQSKAGAEAQQEAEADTQGKAEAAPPTKNVLGGR